MLSIIKQGLVRDQNYGVANNELPSTGPTLQARDENEDDIEDVSDGEWNAGADGDIELEILVPTKGEENEVHDSEDDIFFDALENLTLDDIVSRGPVNKNTSKETCCTGQAASGSCCQASARTFWLRFIALPLELREMVYTEMFADLPNSIILRPQLRRREECFSPIVPAICYTNKQILSESVPVLLRGRELHIGCYLNFDVLERFLDQVPGAKARRAITAVRFENPFGPGDINTLATFSGLHSIHAELSAYSCVIYDLNNKTFSRQPIFDLRKHYATRKIASMLTPPSLRRLTIDYISESFRL